MLLIIRPQREKSFSLLLRHLATFVRGTFRTVDKNWSWPLVGTVLRRGGEGVVGYEVHFLAHKAIRQATATWEALEFVDSAGDE